VVFLLTGSYQYHKQVQDKFFSLIPFLVLVLEFLFSVLYLGEGTKCVGRSSAS
jgi:hypothetical protein